MRTSLHRTSVIVVAIVVTLVLAWASAAGAERLSHGDQRIFRQAFVELDKGRSESALRIARRGTDPVLGKTVHWQHLVRGGTGVTFGQIQEFRQENPHWPRQQTLRAHAEIRLPPSLSDQEVLDFFGATPPTTINGTIRLAEALLGLGRAQEAEVLIRSTWIDSNFTAAEEGNFRARFSERLTMRDHRLRLDRLLWDGRVQEARRQALRVDKPYQQLAQARLALRASAPGVDGALRKVPSALRKDPGLLFERALWRKRKGRYEDTLEILYDVPERTPQADKWWEIRKWAAREALDRKDYRLAYSLSARNGLSEGLGFAEAEWFAGWVALRYLGEPAKALRHFKSMYDGVTTPISQARGAYWAGRATEVLGRDKEALAWFREAGRHTSTFYGQLALERHQDVGGTVLPVSPPPPLAQRIAFRQRELVRVVRRLTELGREDLTGSFLTALVEQAANPDEYYLVADLATDMGRKDKALDIAKDALRFDGHVLPHLYPLSVAGVADNPEPALVLAVIRQESAFQEQASSPAGALGLMQLMPATAREVAKKHSVTYRKRRLVQDPYYNVRLGRAYLAEMIDYFDGSYILAVASYNAGPGRARRWIEASGDPRDPDVDSIDWIERIPFDETRNYVQRVLENLMMYRLLLNVVRTSDTTLGQILKQ